MSLGLTVLFLLFSFVGVPKSSCGDEFKIGESPVNVNAVTKLTTEGAIQCAEIYPEAWHNLSILFADVSRSSCEYGFRIAVNPWHWDAAIGYMSTKEVFWYIMRHPGTNHDFNFIICGVDSPVKIKYDNDEKKFHMVYRYSTPTGNYTFSGWGVFTNSGRSFDVSYLKNNYTDSRIGDKVVVRTYYNIGNNVKNVLVEKFNSTNRILTSYLMMIDIESGSDLSCDMCGEFPSHSTEYAEVVLNSHYAVVGSIFGNGTFGQNHTIQHIEDTVYATDCVDADKCINGKWDAEYYLYPLSRMHGNLENVRFILWERPHTPFYDYEEYLRNDENNIRTRFIEGLGFRVMEDKDMESDKKARNFGLFSISVRGHVTMGFVDLRADRPEEVIYLADYSLFHYYEEEKDPISGKNVLKTIFGSLRPTKLKLDEDDLEQIRQRSGEYVRLLNNNNLQECSTCFLWFSESMIYINNNFRHGNQVIKAYDIGKAQVEIGFELSKRVDGPGSGRYLGLTLDKPKNMRYYNRFFYFSFEPNPDEFDASKLYITTKPVYILNKEYASGVLLTAGFEEMLLQKQKQFLPLVFLGDALTKNEEYMGLITPGFFGIKNKMRIQDRIETGEIYIELFTIIENENNRKNYAFHLPRKLLVENANNLKIPEEARWENYRDQNELGKYKVYTNKNRPDVRIYVLDEKKYRSNNDLDTDGLVGKIKKYGWEHTVISGEEEL
ncbi:MAG: hypothetical protein LBI70_00585 [Rickettsiales bacterium]|jgi:hypothetical protein|nr:hypothetical protein [Rickettsiales bacterium]